LTDGAAQKANHEPQSDGEICGHKNMIRQPNQVFHVSQDLVKACTNGLTEDVCLIALNQTDLPFNIHS
tara:strand:- start:121 stop:324 length:204 start_codon:yes stop_codon:yes gene_type:complete